MRKQIPQLDAVRGVAILLVMAHNLRGFSMPPFSWISLYGWMGVDLFFVLSGFLITGILLDAKPAKDYFRNFYARRCLRIWPLYYSTIFFMFVIVPLLRPQNAAEIFQRSNPWWSYLFFVQNFLVGDSALSVGPLGVSWSLAVEELFYLVWPFFVRFLSIRALQVVAWGVLVVSPLLRLFFVSHHWLIYSNPFCRVDGMMAGALLAILVRKPDFAPRRWVLPAWVTLLMATPLAIVFDIFDARWLTFSMDVLAFGGFIYLAMYSASTWLKACLTNRFLMYTGTISYGLYLLHKLPDDALKKTHVYEAHHFAVFWGVVAASYGLAICSWNLLEKPFLRLKRFFEGETIRAGTTNASLSPARDPEAT